MFNFLKTKKRIKAVQKITQIIYSALFSLLDLENGNLQEKLKDDSFIIAYIYGISAFMTISFRIDNVRQKGFLIYEVYEKIFPEYGKEITERCNKLIADNDNQFLSIVNKAISEIEFVSKNNGNGSLPTLIDYIEKNYDE